MDAVKLNNIIRDKNERLEENALCDAARIIDEIAREQQNITNSQKRIADLRKTLTGLEVQQIDPAAILG